MNYSIWLMNRVYRVDLVRHNANEWTASMVRVVDNQPLAIGYAYSLQTAVGELYDQLAGRELHQLAEALDRAELPSVNHD